MTNFIDWFITSSEDPTKVSLFIKSLASFAILFGLDSTVVSQAGNAVVSLITSLGVVVSAIAALWGLIRKFKNGQWSAVN